MKPPRLITRRRVKWAGTVTAALLLVVAVASTRCFITYRHTNSARMTTSQIGFGVIGVSTIRQGVDPSEPLPPSNLVYGWTRDAGLVYLPALRMPTGIMAEGSLRLGDGYIVIPSWLPLLLIAAPTVWLWYTDRRAKSWQCPKCRYDLRGLDGGSESEPAICPECGHSAKRT